jgi:hypothetical protein
LYGQLQFPVAVGRGPAKFTGKAKMGSFSAEMWNTFFFGPGATGTATPTTTGGIQAVNGELCTAGTFSSHTYTFANTASGTFDVDLGVSYIGTGNALTKVSSAPAVGQYSVNTGTGVWTFNASDTNATAANLKVSYTWLPSSPTRLIQAIYNTDFPMGSAPTFEIVHSIPYVTGGTDATFKIYSAMASKLSFGFKNTDFTVPDIDFMMFANGAGRVFDIILDS